jgi:RNA binding exosome subunit
MKGPVQSLELSCLVHATEDEGRVRSSLKAALGTEEEGEAQELTGHFGNRIVQITYHLTGEEAAHALASVLSKLSKGARAEALANLESMVDQHSALYVRLDKQSVMRGSFELGNKEPVRVRVKPRLYSLKGGAIEFYRAALAGGR